MERHDAAAVEAAGQRGTGVLRNVVREWVIPLGIEVVAVYLAIQYVFFLVLVPTGSMRPAIAEGTWLFVTRMYAPERTVERGDILVFESGELGKTLIKRVIGLPGETVELDGAGGLCVDGMAVKEPYVVYPSEAGGRWTVPEGCYLFLGDNRAESYDARYWDSPYIRQEDVTGEARFVLWPPGAIGLLKKDEFATV